MKNLLTTFLAMLAALSAFAQDSANFTGSLAEKTNLTPKQVSVAGQQKAENGSGNDAIVARPESVQLFFGSQGIGADFRYGFLSKLSARAGFGIIPVTVNGIFSFSSFSTSDQLSARFSNIHLLADYSPFKWQHFRLVGGAAYLLKGNANALISPNGNYQFGNTTVNSSQIGSLNASVEWKGFAPYLGFAVFSAFPNRFFNTNIDIGTYYLSSPSTSLTGTKMLADNSSQEPQFNQNMQGYRWMPVLQLNFNFRLK